MTINRTLWTPNIKRNWIGIIIALLLSSRQNNIIQKESWKISIHMQHWGYENVSERELEVTASAYGDRKSCNRSYTHNWRRNRKWEKSRGWLIQTKNIPCLNLPNDKIIRRYHFERKIQLWEKQLTNKGAGKRKPPPSSGNIPVLFRRKFMQVENMLFSDSQAAIKRLENCMGIRGQNQCTRQKQQSIFDLDTNWFWNWIKRKIQQTCKRRGYNLFFRARIILWLC